MLRAVIGVVVGYIAIFIWTAVSLTAMWLIMGPEFAYPEGTLEVSTGWCVGSIVLGLIGAVIGGYVCQLIAASPTNRPVAVFAGLIFVLGIAMAVAHVATDTPGAEPEKPVEELTVFEAASESVAPAWYNFAMPVVGAVGILLGGRLKGPRREVELSADAGHV